MKTRTFIAALCCITLSALAQKADPAKVAQVKAGTLKEARVSWWGFAPADSTTFLQAAIDSKVPKLIVDKMPSPWITGKTLILVSNQEIVFEEGAVLEAKRGCFLGTGDPLVRLSNIENVTLRGKGRGALLLMHKADYHKPPYKLAEWRHAVSILSSRKINIFNLTLKDSGGDGIYFGIATRTKPPTDIVVRDVICDGNNRQGISVIAGVNVLIENTDMLNTDGTAPQAGIDFEPNRNDEPIRNFVMRNCRTRNNTGCGYTFYLPNMDTSSGPLEVTLENCTADGDKSSPFNLILPNGPGQTMKGFVKVKDCLFQNAPASIKIQGSSCIGPRIIFDNVTVKNIGTTNKRVSPFIISSRGTDEESAGNIHLNNFTIYDDIERKTFVYTGGGVNPRTLKNISGAITCVRKGKKNTLPFTDEWAKKAYPPRVIRKVSPYDMKNVKFEPLTAKPIILQSEFPRLQPRGEATYLVYAKAGETVKLSVKYGQLAHYKGEQARVTWVTPSGKLTKQDPIPFKETKDYVFKNVPETGFYKLTVYPGTNWSSVRHCDHPVMLSCEGKSIALVSGTGEFFTYVPVGTKEFDFRFWGEDAEGLKVTVFKPDGTILWQKDDIAGIEQCIGEGDVAAKGGIFKIRIQPPTNLPVIEDYNIRLYGIPPFLGPSPELLVKPVK